MTTRITESVEETVRILFKLFHRPSKFALCKAVSSSEADSKLKRSSLLFKRTLPKTVTPKVPNHSVNLLESSEEAQAG